MALLIFATVFRGPSLPGEMRGWFEVFMEIALAMALVAIIWQSNPWISAFLALTWVSMFYPHYGPMSYLAGRSVFNGCLWYTLIVTTFKPESLPLIYKTLRILVYFHVFVAAAQIAGVAGYLSMPGAHGLMSNPLELSALVVFCLPAFLALPGRRKMLIAVPIVGALLAKQFLGVAAMSAGLTIYMTMTYRSYYWFILLAVAIVAACWIFLDAPGIKPRIPIWKAALHGWKQHWIMGSGIGHWKAVFAGAAKDGFRWKTAHNEPLQMLFELGAASLAVMLGYVTQTYRSVLRYDLALAGAALTTIIVYSLASFPFHVAPTAMVAVTWLAILDIEINGNKVKIKRYLDRQWS